LIIKDGPEKPENAYLREFYCGYMDVIWLCFSVTDRESFENLYKKWYKGLRLSCPQAPIILVALKCDLRQNEQAVLEMNRAGGLLPISTEEGLEMSKKFKAAQYVECSAWSKIGMRRVFEEGIRAVYRSNRDFRLK
jgi:GTPase SAR1 family protein